MLDCLANAETWSSGPLPGGPGVRRTDPRWLRHAGPALPPATTRAGAFDGARDAHSRPGRIPALIAHRPPPAACLPCRARAVARGPVPFLFIAARVAPRSRWLP